MSRKKVIKYIHGKQELTIALVIERNGTQIQIVTPAQYFGAKIKETKSMVLKNGKLISTCDPGNYLKALADLRTLLGVLDINKEAPKEKSVSKKKKDDEED